MSILTILKIIIFIISSGALFKAIGKNKNYAIISGIFALVSGFLLLQSFFVGETKDPTSNIDRSIVIEGDGNQNNSGNTIGGDQTNIQNP